MNTVLNAFKDGHLARESSRVDDAMAGIRSLLFYRNENVRTLTYRLLTMDRSSFSLVFGACVPELDGFIHTASSRGISTLEGISHFISYHLLDDGEPGIGYMKYDEEMGYVMCPKDQDGAMPYFHISCPSLQKVYPDAEWLNDDNALKVLDFYVEKHAQDIEMYKDEAWLFGEDQLKPTNEEKQLRALADELVANGPDAG